MDAATLISEPALGLSGAGRLAGELVWWIDADGRMGVSAGVSRAGCDAVAAGRVCPASRIGVIEQLGRRAAVLGLLPRGVVDVLAARFPGVRWAVADVVPTLTGRPAPRG
jgi:hypothetical protein